MSAYAMRVAMPGGSCERLLNVVSGIRSCSYYCCICRTRYRRHCRLRRRSMMPLLSRSVEIGISMAVAWRARGGVGGVGGDSRCPRWE